MNITIDSRAFKMIMDKLTLLETALKAQNAKYGLSKYMSEEEVMQVTDLSKSSLRSYRRQGILTGTTSSGRKIKYLRKEVEALINGDMAGKLYALKVQLKGERQQHFQQVTDPFNA